MALDFTGVDNDATIVQELTQDKTVSEIQMERNGISGNDNAKGKEEDYDGEDENVTTVTEAANIA